MNPNIRSMSRFSKISLIACLILGVIGFSDIGGEGMFFLLARPMSAILFIVIFISYLMEDQET